MDYELFHDESKVKGYWHGMLLVPITQKAAILNLLAEARSNSGYSQPISLKHVRKPTGTMHDCSYGWITVAVAALMSRVRADIPQVTYLGQRLGGHKEYSLFSNPIRAKLILFRERDNLSSMRYVTQYGDKVEITFRIALKAGLHSLGSDDDPIRIARIHFDGNEHHRRGVSRHRVIDRLEGLRSYCQFSNRSDLIDDRSGNPKNPVHQEPEDCELLQLVDLLIGSFRSVLTNTTNPHHAIIVAPVKGLVKRQLTGRAWLRNSRWSNSIWMGESWLENGKWHFQSMEMEQQPEARQLELGFKV